MAANDAVSMNVAENRQNVPMAIQENRAAVPMTVAEGGGAGGLNRKADKVTGAVAGNLAGLDSTGNLTDSGKAPGDFLEAPAAAGSEGQVLTADGEGGASWQDPTGGDPTEIIDDTAGDGDTDKVWSADKSHELLTEINSRYTKPNTGIPASDMASSVQTSLNNADSAYQKPQTGIPATDMAEGVIPDITGKADKTVTDALQKNKAPVIIDSAEGNPIVLTDGADGLPVESMKIHFLPVQSGTGDPSPENVRPISGWTGLTAWRTGKNLLPLPVAETKNGITLTHNADGSITLDGTSTSLTYFDFFSGDFDSHNLAGYKFVAVGYSSIEGVSFRISESDRVVLQSSTNGSMIISDNGNGLYFAIRIASSTAMPTGGLTIYPMLIESEADSTFEPYTGQSYPVTFGQTVYGGTLDAVNGVLTVEYVCENVAGNISVNGTLPYGGAQIKWIPTHAKKYASDSAHQNEGLYCNVFDSSEPTPSGECCVTGRSTSGNVFFNMPQEVTNIQEAQTWFNNNQTQVAYLLATHIEIQLDPITVQTLIGDNTIWSDANGTIELDYRADTKLWISGHSTTVDSALSDTSENPVQNKVIKTALDGKEPKHNTTTVSGTTPTITGVADTRYICGECATLSITAPASGCIDIVFESGSTPTVLTVTSAKTNTTIKWANGFDPTALEANTTYEINILDGEFGVVGSWT